MGENPVELLKALLKREIEVFCRRHDPLWSAISDTVETICQNKWRAVFFGGTLRSLLISRLVHRREGRPRDVDIVIQGPPLESLRRLFRQLVVRETRFGGLQLRRAEWRFDVWPLEQTWAIVRDRIGQPDFAYLPRTTFLNIEAAAIDVWPPPGEERQIYSGDDQFFRAIIDRVVEMNRVENPFPELCVVRSLVITSELGFRLGPQLARYIAQHGRAIPVRDLEAIQNKHYGQIRVEGAILREWIHFVSDSVEGGDECAIRLPIQVAHSYDPRGDGCSYDFLRTVGRWQQRKRRPT